MRLRPLAAALAVVLVPALALPSASARAAPRPRLGVLVVFDQLRAIDVDRLAPLFGPGGFGGLDALGAARFDVRYPYAATETGPGHATLATGASPAVHGIVVNAWYDESGKLQPVVDDPGAPVLGAADGHGRSPFALNAGTLGDALRTELGKAARVVTLSIKDRAAILTGGRAVDLAIWFDAAVDGGRYTTSRAYRDALPPWLADLGKALPAASMATGTWRPLPLPRAPKGVAALLPPDDLPGEVGGSQGLGPTFPHDLQDVAPDLRAKAYRASPQSLDDLVTLALAAVDHEALGADLIPDLLVVSFSATDLIGHLYGPTSLEHAEMLRRADLALRHLVKGLTQRLGRSGFALAVSSDHGSTPVPEQLAAAGLPGGRVTYTAVTGAAADALARALPGDAKGKARVLGFSPPHLWLALADLAPADAARARAAVKRAVAAIAGIAAVLDLDDPADDAAPYRAFYAACRVPGRSGTLFVRQEARFIFGDEPGGTDHGSPYLYDRRVPLWLVGPGVRAGRYSPDGDARDVAPTLAFMLGVAPPDSAEGTVLPAVGERAR